MITRTIAQKKDTPDWVKETVEAIENAGAEERYFCPSCGFSVIMPVMAEIFCETCTSCGMEEILVGQKDHMVASPVLYQRCPSLSRHRLSCPFHPEIELVCTAYRRAEA
jgi:ribosomal protein L37AE/L43A